MRKRSLRTLDNPEVLTIWLIVAVLAVIMAIVIGYTVFWKPKTVLVGEAVGTGKLPTVSNLGDEYTPAEAQLRRIFDRLTSRIEGIIIMAAEDQAKAIGDQLNKAKGEIDNLVSSLQGSAVDQATLDQLQATSQALDDIVPDQVVNPEPTPEEPTQ